MHCSATIASIISTMTALVSPTWPQSDAPVKHQDRGGLIYPSRKLPRVLYCLKKFIKIALATRSCLKQPLKEAVENATQVSPQWKVLMRSSPGHHWRFLEVLLPKFSQLFFLLTLHRKRRTKMTSPKFSLRSSFCEKGSTFKVPEADRIIMFDFCSMYVEHKSALAQLLLVWLPTVNCLLAPTAPPSKLV